MDDRLAYGLNSLWSGNYELGRILRFREVPRGRQATCYEVLTAEGNEYCMYLFPEVYTGGMERMCEVLEALERERFLVVGMVAGREGKWVGPGPQGTRMVVGRKVVGQYRLPDEWSVAGLAQLGLRLAWMHRLLGEVLAGQGERGLGAVWGEAMGRPRDGRVVAALEAAEAGEGLKRLGEKVGAMEGAGGWVHGDVQPAGVLVDEEGEIRTFVDWGLVHAGEPLEDVVDAFVHWCVGRDGTVDGERGRVLLEAYQTMGGGGGGGWETAVTAWLGRRVVEAVGGRRGLPRGLASYVKDPGGLRGALEFCGRGTEG